MKINQIMHDKLMEAGYTQGKLSENTYYKELTHDDETGDADINIILNPCRTNLQDIVVGVSIEAQGDDYDFCISAKDVVAEVAFLESLRLIEDK